MKKHKKINEPEYILNHKKQKLTDNSMLTKYKKFLNDNNSILRFIDESNDFENKMNLKTYLYYCKQKEITKILNNTVVNILEIIETWQRNIKLYKRLESIEYNRK